MITRIQNTPQAAFGRGFNPNEMKSFKKGNLFHAFEIGAKIGSGEISAKDGARAQLKAIENIPKRDSAGFKLSEETYYLLDEVEKGKEHQYNRKDGELLPHELHAVGAKDVRTIMSVAVAIGKGLINADKALEQIGKHTESYGQNKMLTVLRKHLEPLSMSPPRSPQSAFMHVFRPGVAVHEKQVRSKRIAVAFTDAFTPPSAKKSNFTAQV